MPWKNGLGITEEILRFPFDSDDFDWRISRAIVTGSGPFSFFKNYNREIGILKGSDMNLQVDSQVEVELNQRSQPFSFSGDASTFATVKDKNLGLIDFNLIVKRGSYTHQISRTSSDIKLLNYNFEKIKFMIFYCNQGKLHIYPNATSKDALFLTEGQTCVIECEYPLKNQNITIQGQEPEIDYFSIKLF